VIQKCGQLRLLIKQKLGAESVSKADTRYVGTVAE